VSHLLTPEQIKELWKLYIKNGNEFAIKLADAEASLWQEKLAEEQVYHSGKIREAKEFIAEQIFKELEELYLLIVTDIPLLEELYLLGAPLETSDLKNIPEYQVLKEKYVEEEK